MFFSGAAYGWGASVFSDSAKKEEHTMTYAQLKQKEIINTCDGARLGNVCDLDLSPDGRILALITPRPFPLRVCSRAKAWSFPGARWS